MNKHTLLICIALVLSVASIYFYKQNQSLSASIATNNEQCERRLAMLQEKYQNRPTALVAQAKQSLPQQPQINAEQTADEQDVPTVKLENLVSYGHRVQAVTNKYEFLLVSAQVDDADRDLLRRLLVQRERLANEIAFAEQEGAVDSSLEDKLFDVEDQIQLVLNDPLDYERYEFLKERSL